MEVSSLIIISIVGLLIQYLIVAYAVHNATAIIRQFKDSNCFIQSNGKEGRNY